MEFCDLIQTPQSKKPSAGTMENASKDAMANRSCTHSKAIGSCTCRRLSQTRFANSGSGRAKSSRSARPNCVKKTRRRGRGYVRVRSFEAGECRLLGGREFRRRSRWIPLISRAEVHRNCPFDALPEAIEMLKHPVASNCLWGRFGTIYNHVTAESRCPLGTPDPTTGGQTPM